jgi:hypothetical protein
MNIKYEGELPSTEEIVMSQFDGKIDNILIHIKVEAIVALLIQKGFFTQNEYKSVVHSVAENYLEEAKKRYLEMVPLQTKMMYSLDKVIDINISDAKSANEDILSTYINSNKIIITLTIFGLAVAIMFGVLISKVINTI